MDPGLEPARKSAYASFLHGGGGGVDRVRICNSRSLSSYWADEDYLTPELSKCTFIRQLMSDTEGLALVVAAAQLGKEQHFPLTVNCSLETDEIIQHDVVYLHRAGYFAAEWPLLFKRLIAAMREQTSIVEPDLELFVRCVELHTYHVGGALLMPDHRDNGSKLTMSLLLSDPALVDGGDFITWAYEAEARAVCHDIRRGDAIFFDSEKLHNVSTVTRGIRHALVIELWRQPANNYDRFS